MAGMISIRGILRCIAACFCISAYICPATSPLAAAVATHTVTPEDALADAPAAQIAVSKKGLPLAILKDQIPIWTSPVRIRTHDLIWLLPLGAATGLTLATDTDAMRNVSRDRSFNKDSVNASNYLLGCEMAVPVGLYGVGIFNGSAQARETGILSSEALADSVVVEEVTRIIFRREHPSLQQCGR